VKGWRKSQLGDIAVITYGYTAKASFENVGLKFLRITDIQNEMVDWSSVPYCPIDEDDLKKQKLIDQDIVFARTGATTGKSYLVCNPPESVAASYLIRLRVQDKNVSAKFISKYFQTREYWDNISSGISGSAQGGFNASKLSALVVPIPPLSEQKRIVSIVDEAFEVIDRAIANTEKNLTNARELFESYLNAVFTQKGDGWEEKKIEEVCESIIDCINKTAVSIDKPSPFKMIRTTNVRNGLINLNSVKYVTEETYHKWTRRQTPKKGDVLLTREAPMGEVGMLLTDDLVFLGQRIVSYRTNHNILDNRFLLYAFQSSNLQDQIHAFASGSTVQHMRVPDTKVLRIATPSISIQREVIQKLDVLLSQTQRLEAIYKQKLAALKELKQSILQKAFAGELTADTANQTIKTPEDATG
jgi:type I restriction enzyme S subunit